MNMSTIPITQFNIEQFKKDFYEHFHIEKWNRKENKSLISYCGEMHIIYNNLWRILNGKYKTVTPAYYQICELMGKSVNDYKK